ncbi:ArsR family transcriptional regulator [Arthrobacter sp. MPF02]|uniref:arsenate reductase/protein-tyrosine-phosphatase family protein n=1 Tax=Arthrobacter sp. MPF02 TaxID=3388492 RepID=UPI0039852325
MKTEQSAAFRQRVAMHSALADAARLRIVDLLALGDLSPSELQSELGVASNLLSHHLRTLEEAGIVVRQRSEADRRRSYIHLVRGGLDHLMPGMEHRARRVLFVCTRNSARSQLAAALWRQASAVPSESAGTHPADRIAGGALAVAARRGLPLPEVAPQRLDQVQAEGDFVVTVCDNAHEEIPGLHAVHWSIPDPVRVGTPAAFEDAYELLAHRVADLAPRLVAA